MQIKTPDIGVDKAVVAEILVKVGDSIAENDSLVLLESDKASVEVPSTSAGVVKSILIKEGDSVTEGTVLFELEAEGAAQAAPEPTPAPAAEKPAAPAPAQQAQASTQPAATTSTATVDVTVPDIGVEKALVGEILVKVGDQIDVEQSIVVVESDKATVEVPSSTAGIVESIQVKEGDTVKEGVVLIQVKTTSASSAQAEAPASTAAPAVAAEPVAAKQETVAAAATQSGPVDINVPDLGVDKAVVAEILVQVGDKVDVDQSLVVVESDKATVEVPSTVAGIVKAIHLQAGQQVSQGLLLATIEAEGQAPAGAPAAKAEAAPAPQAAAPKAAAPAPTQAVSAPASGSDKLTKEQEAENAKVYAGPAVRKLARELGVILSQVKTSGEHGRVVKEDIFAYVKSRLTAPQAAPVAAAAPAVSGLPKLPDFTAFGGVEEKY